MILANVLEHVLGSTLSWRAPGCSCSLCPWQSSSESWQPWRYCKLNHKGIVSRKFNGEQIGSSCYLLGINHRRFCLLSEVYTKNSKCCYFWQLPKPMLVWPVKHVFINITYQYFHTMPHPLKSSLVISCHHPVIYTFFYLFAVFRARIRIGSVSGIRTRILVPVLKKNITNL